MKQWTSEAFMLNEFMTFISVNASVSVFVTIPFPHGGQAWFQEKMSRGKLFKRAGGEL